MTSTEIYSFITTMFCISIFIHYTSSQPLLVDPMEENALSKWELYDHSLPKLFLGHGENNYINLEASSEPMRRANFWKRANFWRKRANFWRRDLAS